MKPFSSVIDAYNLSCDEYQCKIPPSENLASYEKTFQEALQRSLPPAVPCPTALLIVASDKPLPATNLLRRSANALGVPLAVPYLPQGAQALRRRVYNHTLSAMGACPDTAVLLVDAFDTYLRCNATEIRRRVNSFGPGAVIVSAERLYTFQKRADRHLWDELGRPSVYRYVNGGGVGGFHIALSKFTRAAAAEAPPPYTSYFRLMSGRSDQDPIARLVLRDANATKDRSLGSRLDYNASLFLTLTGSDWISPFAIKSVERSNPCIVHVPNKLYRQTLRDTFEMYRNSSGPVNL